MANVIMVYTGNRKSVSKVGKVSGIKYAFGSSKREFWVDHEDVPGLLASLKDDIRLRGSKGYNPVRDKPKPVKEPVIVEKEKEE